MDSSDPEQLRLKQSEKSEALQPIPKLDKDMLISDQDEKQNSNTNVEVEITDLEDATPIANKLPMKQFDQNIASESVTSSQAPGNASETPISRQDRGSIQYSSQKDARDKNEHRFEVMSPSVDSKK